MTTGLTVATFNIHGGVGVDGVHDLTRIADLLVGTRASVVAVQEVNRRFSLPTTREPVDQVDELADRLGMRWVFGPNVSFAADHARHPGRQYGVAILTSLPLHDSNHALLPRRPGSEQRGFVEARVDLGGTALRVVSTHFQHTDRFERVDQARALTAHLATTAAGADEPTVLMGDFNTKPGTPEYAVLTTGLADAWVQAGRGRGHTLGPRLRGARIDYVLLGGPVRATAAQVWRTATSDHDLVSADLVLAHA